MDNLLITGSTGFLGKYLALAFYKKGYNVSQNIDFMMKGHKYDLTDFEETNKLFNSIKPKYVVHAAGYNGGIDFNLKYPASIFIQNTTMNMNILQSCANYGVKKLVSIVASCAYPDSSEYSGVYSEYCFLNGKPHDSVIGHGYAKRCLQVGSKLLNREIGLNAVTVCPTTIYGPGDTTDLQRTKVMMALILKIMKAKENNSDLVMRGQGLAKRQFIYVEDAANRIVDVFEHYNDSNEPINLIGAEDDISIRELVTLIVRLVDYKGNISWDNTNEGQMRKKLTSFKQNRLLPAYTYIPLEEGIKRTIEWIKVKNSPK